MQFETKIPTRDVSRIPTILNHHIAQSFKGGLDQSHFIFEINVGKRRIRHTTTLKLNGEFLDRLKIG